MAAHCLRDLLKIDFSVTPARALLEDRQLIPERHSHYVLIQLQINH